MNNIKEMNARINSLEYDEYEDYEKVTTVINNNIQIEKHNDATKEEINIIPPKKNDSNMSKLFNSPVSKYIVKSGERSTHRTFIRGNDDKMHCICFDIGLSRDKIKALQDILRNVILCEKGEFNFNAFPYDPDKPSKMDVLGWMDFDYNKLSEETREIWDRDTISESVDNIMSDLYINYKYTDFIKEGSPNVHRYTNVCVNTTMWKSILTYVKIQLWQGIGNGTWKDPFGREFIADIDDGIPADEFNSFFDISSGLNIPYSFKYVPKTNEIKLEYYKLPDENLKGIGLSKKIPAIVEYDIYVGKYLDDTAISKRADEINKIYDTYINDILGKKVCGAEVKKIDSIEEYIKEIKTQCICGNNVEVLKNCKITLNESNKIEIFKSLFSCLSADRKMGKKWNWWLIIAKCLNIPYNYFDSWSQPCNQYNAINNKKIWDNADLYNLTFEKALSALIHAAREDNIDKVRDFYREHKSRNIFDPECKVYYSDYIKYLSQSGNCSKEEFMGFIENTMAFIVNGGKSIFVTKNLKRNSLEFDYISPKAINNMGSIKYNNKDYNQKEADECEEKGTIYKQKKFIIEKMGDIITSLIPNITYNYVDFIPYLNNDNKNKNIFNLFTGFQHRYDENFVVDTSKFDKISKHIKEVWCKGSDEIYEYITFWFANILQNPTNKIGVAILLKSQMQGAGKNIICEFIGKHVIGQQYYITLNDIDQIIGRFNSSIENKLLTVCDEVQNYGGAHKSNDKLKSIITQNMQLIERKGVDIQKISDYNNYIFLTNNDWPIKIENGDRRYLALELDNKYANNKEYFTELSSQINDDAGKHFFHWLANIDITKWNHRNIPNTDLKRQLKLNSVSVPIQYIIDLAKKEADYETLFSYDNIKCSSSTLYFKFTEWKKEHGFIENISSKAFSLDVNKIIKTKQIKIDGKNVRGINTSIQNIRESIREFLKTPDFNFGDDDDNEGEEDLQEE